MQTVLPGSTGKGRVSKTPHWLPQLRARHPVPQGPKLTRRGKREVSRVRQRPIMTCMSGWRGCLQASYTHGIQLCVLGPTAGPTSRTPSAIGIQRTMADILYLRPIATLDISYSVLNRPRSKGETSAETTRPGGRAWNSPLSGHPFSSICGFYWVSPSSCPHGASIIVLQVYNFRSLRCVSIPTYALFLST